MVRSLGRLGSDGAYRARRLDAQGSCRFRLQEVHDETLVHCDAFALQAAQSGAARPHETSQDPAPSRHIPPHPATLRHTSRHFAPLRATPQDPAPRRLDGQEGPRRRGGAPWFKRSSPRLSRFHASVLGARRYDTPVGLDTAHVCDVDVCIAGVRVSILTGRDDCTRCLIDDLTHGMR